MKYDLNDISVEIFQSNRATIAEAVITLHLEDLPHIFLKATGEALRHPEDKHDSDVGVTLATARALSGLARKLERQANGRVKMHDDNRRRHDFVEANTRCTATTNSGSRCSRRASDGDLCGIHARSRKG